MGLLDFKNTLQQVKDDLLGKPKEELLGKIKEELLGETKSQDPGGEKNYKEKFFMGWRDIKRYYQALYYGQPFYGMECNGTTIMYFLQNLGLYPIEMTRKEFEYAFIPDAHPYSYISPQKKSQTPITINNQNVTNANSGVLPISNDKSLFPSNVNTQALLGALGLGSQSGISVVKQSLNLAISKLNNITINFATKLPSYIGYTFVKSYHQKAVTEIINKTNSIKDLTQRLANNEFDDSYFNDGKCIFVSVNLGDFDGATEHYALIQGKSLANFMFNEKTYYIYPADDADFGRTFVIAPTFLGGLNDINLPGISGYTFTHEGYSNILYSVSKNSLQLGLS
ncbi:MAG: hypothetical protein MUC49_21180 [Raineya sp.]|jgi:hypothetical protein|nr:hypothetical protein [Raineya sp.]